MPIQLRQLSSAAIQRNSNTRQEPHNDFSGGMIRDMPSYLAPDNSSFDIQDMLVDRAGKLRKRGGTTTPGGTGATVENLTPYKSGAVDGLAGLFGSLGKGGLSIRSFNRTTGASTSVIADGSVDTYACDPFQHYDLMVFPFQAKGTTANDRNQLYIAGGGTQALASGSPAFTVTAGDNRITGLTGAALTSAALGSIIQVGTASYYWGRIIEVTSATAVRVSPTPTANIAATTYAIQPAAPTGVNYGSNASPFSDVLTGRFGLSYQGRIVLAYTLRTPGKNASDYVKGLDYQQNRIAWSYLATETVAATGFTVDGLNYFTQCPFAQFSYTDIPELGGITGIAQIGDGQLIVFGPTKMYRISGQLTTNTATTSNLLYSVDKIANNIGCVNSKSIQNARDGVIWAGSDDIYLYDGETLRPLLSGKVARWYQARLKAGDVIYGSACNVNTNHYYLSMSGTDGGICINLDNRSIVRFTGVSTLIFDSATDPEDPSKLFTIRWWDTTGAAPGTSQLYRFDPIWLPASTNKSDGDGTAVLGVWISKAYVGDSVAQKKLYRNLHITYSLIGSGPPSASGVAAENKLDSSTPGFIALGVAALAATGTSGTDTATVHADVTNLLSEGPAIRLRITQFAAADTFEIDGINFEYQERVLT